MIEKLKASAFRLDQKGVNDAYSSAGEMHELRVMQYLDDPERPGIHPDQEGVNEAYHSAVRMNQFGHLPYNEAYDSAAKMNQLRIMQYLDDPARPGIHPDQEGVNKAFDYA